MRNSISRVLPESKVALSLETRGDREASDVGVKFSIVDSSESNANAEN